MQVWVAIVERQPGRTTEVEVGSARDLYLPFHPRVTHQATWRGPSGHTALHTWSNGPAEFPAGLAEQTDWAVSLSGYALDQGRLAGPSDLAARLGPHGSDDAVAHLGGSFSIVHVTDSKVRAWNTAARLEHVYWASNDGLTVVSNRALAAHLIASRTRRPAYEPSFIRSLLAAGFPTTNATPFAGVETLPFQSILSVTAVSINVSSQVGGGADAEPSAALAQALTNSVAFIPEVDPAPRSALTGGKDSRLIAAVLADAGVPFTAVTGGLDEHPDVILAGEVARILDVPHHRMRPGAETTDHAPTHLEHHVMADSMRRIFGSDGTHPAFEMISRDVRVASAAGVVLGGQGGELLRGGYAKRPVPSHKSARHTLGKVILRHGEFLGPAARTVEIRRQRSWWLRSFDPRDPSTALWRYYLEFRTGRWAAAGYAAASVGRPRVWPYFDAAVVRAIASMEPQQRLDERYLVEALRSLAPALVDLPLAGSRWQYEATGPVDGDLAGWTARAPLATPPGRASFDWRLHFSSGLGAMFVDYIEPMLDRPELESILDPAAVAQITQRLRRNELDADRAAGHFAWLLFSIAVLLSDQWLDPNPPKDTIRFPIPN